MTNDPNDPTGQSPQPSAPPAPDPANGGQSTTAPAAQQTQAGWLGRTFASMFSGLQNVGSVRQNQAIVPVQRVGELVDPNAPIEVIIPGPARVETAAERTERHRKTVEKLDDDKETWLDFIFRWFLTINAYGWPIWMAYAIGNEIGSAYGGPFDWGDAYSVGIHSGSMAVEFSLAMLSFATAHALAKAFTDRSFMSKAALAAFFFIFLTIISCVSQWFILEQHSHIMVTTLVRGKQVTSMDGAAMAQALFRTFIGPTVDLGSLVFLSIMKIRSLRKELAKLELKAEAITKLNEREIQVDRATQDAEQLRERNTILMDMERMNLENVREKMRGQMNDGGGRQSRW